MPVHDPLGPAVAILPGKRHLWLYKNALLIEKGCYRKAAAKTVVATAKRTTEDDPILPLPKGDCWQYLNAVLNEVSERFAAGHIKRDLGLPFERGEYLLCLTCERAGLVRTHKIRGMLVRKSLLTNLPEEEPEYESPWHVTRWDTLRHLAQQYEKNPHQFMEVEICL